jgi:hypothetical protein
MSQGGGHSIFTIDRNYNSPFSRFLAVCASPATKRIFYSEDENLYSSCSRCQPQYFDFYDALQSNMIPAKGKKITVSVKSPKALATTILKSDTASVQIPEIEFEVLLIKN